MLQSFLARARERFLPGCWLLYGPPRSGKRYAMVELMELYPFRAFAIESSDARKAQQNELLVEMRESFSTASEDCLLAVVPSIDQWLHESQKALLALIEKTLASRPVMWLFCAESASRLLPALLSRCIHVRCSASWTDSDRPLAPRVSELLKTSDHHQARKITVDLMLRGFLAKEIVKEIAAQVLDGAHSLDSLDSPTLETLVSHISATHSRCPNDGWTHVVSLVSLIRDCE